MVHDLENGRKREVFTPRLFACAILDI